MASHLKFALHRLILEGHLPASTLAWLGHQHLVRSCEACRMEWGVFADKQDDGLPLPPPLEISLAEPLPANDRHLSYESLEQRLHRQERRRDAGKKARRHLAALRRFPPDERVHQIARARTRYRSRAFAELLIEESRRCVRADPREAEHLASLVPAVLQWIPDAADQPWAFELTVRARAWAANAQRVAGDLVAAGRTFASLRTESGIQDLPQAILAELASLEASLLVAQRKLPAAFRKLEAVLMQSSFDSIDRREQVGYVLQMANLLIMMDRPEEALAHFRQAEHLIGPGKRDPQQDLALLSGRVVALCDLEREAEIEEQFTAFRARHAGTDVLTDAIVEGLRARVKLHRGDVVGAASGLLEVQQAFLAADRPYDAALVSLDLALVYLESGRLQELERLAAELVPQFRARGVERETLAALRLLAEAVTARNVTRELLGRLRGQIRPGRRRDGGNG